MLHAHRPSRGEPHSHRFPPPPPPQTTRTGPDTCHQTPALSVTYTLLLFRFTHTLVPTPRTWHVCTTHLTQTHRNLAPGVDPRHIYTVHAPHRVIS